MASIFLSFPLFILLLIFAISCIYAILPILSLLIFYLKESMNKSGRPPIAGTIFHQLIHFDTLFDFHLNKVRKHGTFGLIKPFSFELYTCDPFIIEHILKTRFSIYSKGEYTYEIVNDLFGDGIFAVDGEKWRHQRKLASFEFSTKVLREFSSVVFRSNAEKFCKTISDVASVGKLIDMQDLLMKSTLDSIFKVGFGIELDTLSGTNEQGTLFSKAFDDSNHIVFHRYSDLFWKAKRYLNIGMEARLKKNLKVIDDFVFQLIHEKRELMNSGLERNKEDILSRFILESERDPEMMTDKYLRDIVLNFLIAGKDTSANTLTWFFYMLCKHPLIQEKIAVEINEAVGEEGFIGDGRSFASSLTDQVLDKMQYLHAALTETLRLYPAVPVDAKCAEEDDVLPGGLKMKKGDGITYLIYAMARMVDLWGDDAEEFRPERWIKNGKFCTESPFKFVTFNAGPRMCLGKEFAYRQMKILAAVLLNSFKFILGDESYVARYRTMFTLHMDKGLPLLAFHR